MTITYDPTNVKYFDEVDLRQEMNRVFDLCHGCRLCFKFCTSFPTLFAMVDAKPNQEASLMNAREQDKVVQECFQCKLCDVNCPYTPSQQHEWMLDFPRLMLRATAIQKRKDGRKPADYVFGNTDLAGKLATLPVVSQLANKSLEKPGTPLRKVLAKSLGISSQRLLPPYAKQRFTTWFKKQGMVRVFKPQSRAAIFPTCLVEYQAPKIGKDLVAVYERNKVACVVPSGLGCCGAPWLHSGDIDNFRAQAKKNLKSLSAAIASGHEVVVPQPTCGYVLKKDYPMYLKGEPEHAEAVAISAHVFDSSEFLWKLHKGQETSIDTNFEGQIPATTTYHAACHLQAQQVGLKSRDLIKLTGTKISLVNSCSGIDGTWGLRESNFEIAKKVLKPLGEAVNRAGSEVVSGDCHLANTAIAEETGSVPMHPMTLLARAYGIESE